MKHDSKLEMLPVSGNLFANKKAKREQILQINHKHGSRPRYFNKNTDT